MNHDEQIINTLSVDAKKSLRNRVIVAIIMVLIVVPLLFVGDYGFYALVLFVCAVSTHEIIHTVDKEKKLNKATYFVSYLVTLLPIALNPLFNNLILGLPLYDLVSGSMNLLLSFGYVAYVIIVNFALSIFNHPKLTISDTMTVSILEILVILGALSAFYLRNVSLYDIAVNSGATGVYSSKISLVDRFLTSSTLLIYVILGIIMTDLCAYFVGIFFGKHKMCPQISPKKTWEGFVGGIVGSFIISSAFAILLAVFNYPILAQFDIAHFYRILIASFIMPFVATAGDLVFSLIKRHYEIKDFGTILGSHGGFLDRLDSIFITLIIACFIVTLVRL
ncbi:MAG: phosphatidate cytidylyltransferase [Bacilli bacterium]|nr:phosphatidate cytidylyltransferase [Bacilli bacterium]